ncbi:[NiFe] hydrogenase metallocenter assembly protein HypD [Olavius algarvensis associated proteobacterium Delta 3]|nr:[NiFe] hydrogenase metallocenter assembly protein HypD [Olavius algarvensis associated proteobacterium Delta 3]
MALKHVEEYRDPELSKKLIDRIHTISQTDVRLMEVCGTHTVSIFRSGIRSILPKSISLLSGPGCPVCVTAQGEIDAFIELARNDNVILATFGDLMRVPGTSSSLLKEKADGRDIRVVYSTFDGIQMAKDNPGKSVVFLGVGFETTAPTVAAAIFSARQMNIENFFVYSAHKLVPPALEALTDQENVQVNGFILPGHVSVIIGEAGYQPFFDRHRVPCVITGFEPADILRGISMLVDQIESGSPRLENAYPRAVSHGGNEKAQRLLQDVFEPVDAVWRGIGAIPGSGLKMRGPYVAFDAADHFQIVAKAAPEPKGCACGEILTGGKTPPECPLFRTRCTPMAPVGPCMVSSEGTCAAFYRFHDEE